MTAPARQQVLITIDSTPDSVEPLKLELQIVTPVRRGQPIQGRFVASGGTGGYVYSVDTHVFVLPAGVTMPDATTGVLNGSPTTIAHYEVEASVQDSSSTLVTERFAIDVITSLSIPPGHTPRIGEVGIPYTQPLFVLGATGPVTWGVYSGTIHAGLAVDSLLGFGAAHGTPTAPGGISYAELIATDTVSGDTLIVPFRTDIRDALADTAPDDPIEVVAGVACVIALDEFWSGGVEPFELSALGGIPTGLFLFKNRARKWSMIGTPAFSFSGEDTLWSPVGITVKDALGASWDVAFQIIVRNPINSLGAQLGGVSAGDRTPPVMDFAGSAVKSVARALDGSKFTVTIEPKADATSVLGVAGAVAGDAVSIQATTNNRVLARVGNVLVWTQIALPMISATGTAGATNFLRGDGSWSQVTVGTIFATGSPGATNFLRGNGTWGTVADALGNQSPNVFYTGPASGSAAPPGFRAIVVADMPATMERMVSAQAPAADTISNTNVATAFSTNYTIAAADLKAGCVIRVRAHGSYGATGTPTITLQLRLSNTNVLTLGAYTLAAAANTTSWEFEGDVFVPSIGASVACRANGHGFIGAGAAAAGAIVLPQSTSLSLATNASKLVQVFVTWGTANALNTITLHQLHVEVLG